MLIATWIATGLAAVSMIVSALSFRRAAHTEDAAATDQRIDERIQLKLGADIAVIKNDLKNIAAALTNNADLVRNTIDATQNAISEAAREILRLRE